MNTNWLEKLEEWKQTELKAIQLAKEISAYIEASAQELVIDGAKAGLVPGRGVYDWESISEMVEPDADTIARNSTVVIDYKTVAEETGVTEEIKKAFYTVGVTKTKIELTKPAKRA